MSFLTRWWSITSPVSLPSCSESTSKRSAISAIGLGSAESCCTNRVLRAAAIAASSWKGKSSYVAFMTESFVQRGINREFSETYVDLEFVLDTLYRRFVCRSIGPALVNLEAAPTPFYWGNINDTELPSSRMRLWTGLFLTTHMSMQRRRSSNARPVARRQSRRYSSPLQTRLRHRLALAYCSQVY